MNSLAARFAGAQSWRRCVLLFVLGAIATLGMPPLSFTPALLVALTGFTWTLDGSSRAWRAGWDGWWFGFGFFVSGLYWIANALLTDVQQFAWLIPLAVLALPAVLALFTALAGFFAYLLWYPGAWRVLSLAVAWTAAEWLRGHLFTGFPWNLVGYTWTWSDAALQSASLFGIYGLSFATVFVLASPAALIVARSRMQFDGKARMHGGTGEARTSSDSTGWRTPRDEPRGGRAVVFSLALVMLAGDFAYGMVRLGDATDAVQDGVSLRLVQANVAQEFKWEPDQLRANLERHLVLMRSPGLETVSAVVWPETALPYALDGNRELRQALGALLPRGAVLMTGAPRIETDADGRLITEMWNSVAVLDSTGTVVGTYDKAHLVPFGEYVPLRPLLAATGLDKIVPGILDYSAGTGPRTIVLPGLPDVSPLVCYEVIFPGAVTSSERPAWLLNVTNDAWYGKSAGPYQHFAMARVRAVEEGIPLVRAANTGISGVVDAYGRVRASLGLMEAGVVDSELPVPLPPTFYSRFKDWPVAGLILLLALVLTVGTRIAASDERSDW